MYVKQYNLKKLIFQYIIYWQTIQIKFLNNFPIKLPIHLFSYIFIICQFSSKSFIVKQSICFTDLLEMLFAIYSNLIKSYFNKPWKFIYIIIFIFGRFRLGRFKCEKLHRLKIIHAQTDHMWCVYVCI